MSVLGDALSDAGKIQRDDRVLIFFAGHGTTRALPSGKSIGYIIPVDADTTSFQGQSISMTTFQDINQAIPAKHVFYIMDACYSGLALVRGGAPACSDPRKYLQEITRRQTREMITAGGADQQVADNGPGGHSIFTWTVLQGLPGEGRHERGRVHHRRGAVHLRRPDHLLALGADPGVRQPRRQRGGRVRLRAAGADRISEFPSRSSSTKRPSR